MPHISPPGTKTSRLWKRIDQAADTDRPQPMMTIATGGSLVKVQAAKVPRPAQVRAPRGKITGFSAAARKRLIELLASINQKRLEGLPLFITLTYPATWPDDPRIWKEHLDAWLKRFHRRFTRSAAIWKLEFQSRGAPHFHLLVFGPRWISPAWLAGSWYRVVGSGDIRHYKAGVQVARVKSWRGVMYYASKYLAKSTTEHLPEMPGRFWGISGREYLPFDLIAFPMEFHQFFRLRRMLVRWISGTRGAIKESSRKSSARYRPRIRSDKFGFSLFVEVARVLPLLRALA